MDSLIGFGSMDYYKGKKKKKKREREREKEANVSRHWP